MIINKKGITLSYDTRMVFGEDGYLFTNRKNICILIHYIILHKIYLINYNLQFTLNLYNDIIIIIISFIFVYEFV